MRQILPIAAVVIVLGFIVVATKFHSPSTSLPETSLPIAPDAPQPETKDELKAEIDHSKIYHYADGLALAKKNKVNVLVVFGTDWCIWCKRLEQNTLTSPEMKSAMMKYVLVHVDGDREPDIVAKYKNFVKAYPSYIVIDADEKVLNSGSGYKTVPAFKKWLGN
jgi:thiol:disulfide interchange protein